MLGRELAAAQEAERRHRRAARGPSPLAGVAYDYWGGEHDLLTCRPAPADEVIAGLHARLIAAGPAAWEAVRDTLTMDDLYTVLTFARRTAVLARREHRPDRAAVAVAALALVDSQRVDWRDTVLAAALATAVLRTISPDAAGQITAAARAAEPRTAAILERFVAPTPADADLASWGWMPVGGPGEWGLVGRGSARYEPTIDLLEIAQRIRAVLSGADYLADTIQAGTRLFPVWLPGAPAGAADPVAERCRAALTIGTRLRPDAHAAADAQQLTVFVVEAADEADAASLVQWAVPVAGSAHCAITWQRGRLVVLMIARSFVADVAAYEDDDTLARFRGPVAAVLDLAC